MNVMSSGGENAFNDTRYEEETEEQDAMLLQDEERLLAVPPLNRTYSHDSVDSTESAPPPYNFYPPAETFFGRVRERLRHMLRLRRHQAISLPELAPRRSMFNRPGSLSSSSIDSFASSSYPSTCCSYYFHSITSHLPTRPVLDLPPSIGRFRGLLICLSFVALTIFSFLLFCSIFFSPANFSPSAYPDASTDNEARLLTLNIFMRPPGITNFGSDYKDERLDYIIHHVLPYYDIIAFQEAFAFASRRKDRLIQSARYMGFNYHVESPRHFPWDFGADGGLLVLSRYPIRQSHTIEYTHGVRNDWFLYKGALHALIDLNETRSIHLYTTQTQSSYTPPILDEINVRHQQFEELRQFIEDTAAHDSIPIVLLGDMNAYSGDRDQEHMDQMGAESTTEYDVMLSILSGTGSHSDTSVKELGAAPIAPFADAVYEQFGYHPVTAGDAELDNRGHWVPVETVFTEKERRMTQQNVDTILWTPSRPSIRLNDIRVEKFLVKQNNRLDQHEQQSLPFTQVSDHYGLSCVVQLV